MGQRTSADFPNHCTGGRSAGARRSPAYESFDTGRERGLHHTQQVAARPSSEPAREHLEESARRRWRGSQWQGRSAQGLAAAAEPRDRLQNVGPDEPAYMNMGESSMVAEARCGRSPRQEDTTFSLELAS